MTLSRWPPDTAHMRRAGVTCIARIATPSIQRCGPSSSIGGSRPDACGAGSGIDRGRDRKTWRADLESLPDGTVIIGADGQAQLVLADRLLAFSFGGWTRPEARTVTDVVDVLTPPTSVRALANGFTPVLHPTAG